MYVNEEEVVQCGRIGYTGENEIPRIVPQFVALPGDDNILIAIHISNYHELYGGIPKGLVIGTYKEIIINEWAGICINVFIIGIIPMMCIYHIFLWLWRRQDSSNLYFAFFCLIIIIRTIIANYPVAILFLGDNLWEIHSRLNSLLLPIAWYFLRSYLYRLFPDEFVPPVLL